MVTSKEVSGGRIPVGVLGATGAVGQRLVSLLEGHPQFVLAEVAASERSAGKSYLEATRWILPGDVPEEARGLVVKPVDADFSSPVLLSGLDAAVADSVEPLEAGKGRLVVSNTKSFRMRSDVPLVIPEVNADHLALLEEQPWRASGGGIVTNPNCSVVGLAMALAPLHRAFGVEAVCVTTMQALSGAGYPGVPSLDAEGKRRPLHRRRGGEDRARAEEDPREAREGARRRRRLCGLRLRQPRSGPGRSHRVGLPEAEVEGVPRRPEARARDVLGRAAAAPSRLRAGAADRRAGRA